MGDALRPQTVEVDGMDSRVRRWTAEWLIVICGMWHIGLGLYFIFLRPELLPEDVRYMGSDLQSLRSVAPHFGDWLGKVFTVMGGFMAGAGVLITYFGYRVMPLHLRGTAVILLATGGLTLGLMSAVNFALGSDFRWLLALPPVAWAAALVVYVRTGRHA